MTILIGIDCATKPNKVGLALGWKEGDGVYIDKCCTGSKSKPPIEVVSGWLQDRNSAIIALDAPLGWSKMLGDTLHKHHAGESTGRSSNDLFKRKTDWDIIDRFGKRPLEIGADRISRTAVSALDFLDGLRKHTNLEIPLLLNFQDTSPFGAIEVYPAATRLAHEAQDKGGSLNGLESAIRLNPELDISRLSIDAVDSMVCVLAAGDFLSGLARQPSDVEAAKVEGWIWVADLEKITNNTR